MDQKQRDWLLRQPQVLKVTAQHVFMKDGRLLDPNEFLVDESRIYMIMKLTQCQCPIRHQIGRHLLVEGIVRRNVLGGGITVTGAEKDFCPMGSWQTEEILSEQQAMQFGLIDKDKKLCVPTGA